CSNKNLFRGPGQAQAFIGELAREQTTEIYQTFFGGTDHLPRHLCTPQVNVGVINGPSIFTQVRSNNDRIADAIERSQLIIEKDNSLQPVADDRAILRVKIKQALNEILIAERAETAKIDEEFQKLSYFRKDLALRWASLKGLGGAAWDLAKWIKEVNDLTSMQLRLYRYAKNAATASGTENFYDTFTSLNLDAELRELIDVLGFDPTKVSLDDIKKALDLADQVTSDGPLMRDIGMFIKDFALSQHRLEVAEFGGAAAFEIILTAILTALTGGVGLGVAIASKARLIRQFEKLGKLLSEFAIANKKVGKYLADKAKRGAKSVKRSFDDVKTDAKATETKARPSKQNNKPPEKNNPKLSAANRDRQKINELSDDAHLAELSNNLKLRDEKIAAARDILSPYLDADNPKELLDRLDVTSPKDGAFFWSGYKEGALDAAASLAQKQGGISLETTKGGRIVNNWPELNKSPISGDFWSDFSEKYASSVSGKVKAVQSDVAFSENGGKVWKTTELPTMVKKGNVSEVEILDLSGNVRQVLNKKEMKALAESLNIGGGS
ncbi:hypothetical protein ACFOX3_09770, partial [Simiduia curdlanivorans]